MDSSEFTELKLFNDARIFQRSNGRVAYSKVAQDLLAVLTYLWCWPLGFNVGSSKAHWNVHGCIGPKLRMLNGGKHTQLLGMSILGHFMQAHNRTPDKIGRVENLAPFVTGFRRKGGIKNSDQLGHVAVACFGIDKTLIGNYFLQANGFTQPRQ